MVRPSNLIWNLKNGLHQVVTKIFGTPFSQIFTFHGEFRWFSGCIFRSLLPFAESVGLRLGPKRPRTWIFLATVCDANSASEYLEPTKPGVPSGKLSHNYGKIHHFEWVNQHKSTISTGPFSIATFNYQRVMPTLDLQTLADDYISGFLNAAWSGATVPWFIDVYSVCRGLYYPVDWCLGIIIHLEPTSHLWIPALSLPSQVCHSHWHTQSQLFWVCLKMLGIFPMKWPFFIGIMISKTIGFRGLAYFQTHWFRCDGDFLVVFSISNPHWTASL